MIEEKKKTTTTTVTVTSTTLAWVEYNWFVVIVVIIAIKMYQFVFPSATPINSSFSENIAVLCARESKSHSHALNLYWDCWAIWTKTWLIKYARHIYKILASIMKFQKKKKEKQQPNKCCYHVLIDLRRNTCDLSVCVITTYRV